MDLISRYQPPARRQSQSSLILATPSIPVVRFPLHREHLLGSGQTMKKRKTGMVNMICILLINTMWMLGLKEYCTLAAF